MSKGCQVLLLCKCRCGSVEGEFFFFFVGEGVIELHHKDALQNDFFLKVGGHSKKVM